MFVGKNDDGANALQESSVGSSALSESSTTHFLPLFNLVASVPMHHKLGGGKQPKLIVSEKFGSLKWVSLGEC